MTKFDPSCNRFNNWASKDSSFFGMNGSDGFLSSSGSIQEVPRNFKT